MNVQKTATLLTTCAAALVLAGCSSSGSNPVTVPHQANIAASVLQMNVGTANVAGAIGTNVAVTYRQPAGGLNPGASAALVSSPTLTFPGAITTAAGTPDKFNSTIATGFAPGETTAMTSTPQTPNATAVTTFGNDGGAFGLGLEPFNYAAPIGQAGVSGVPANVVPYAVPLYDPRGGSPAVGGTNPNSFIPGGGPPAFNVANNAAAVDGGFNGISEGLDVFAIPPAAGTYTLSVSVPGNTGTVTQTATAAITSTAGLPLFATPGAVYNADGSVTLTYALPAGVTEAYIQVTDFGPTVLIDPKTQATSCVGASVATPVYYTVEVTASGTSALPAGSVCSGAMNTTANKGTASDGDAFTVQGVGFDYPAYEASYPNSLGKPSPSLAGAGGTHQADVTISAQAVYNIAGVVATPGGTFAKPANAARQAGSAVIRRL
jgi:hypothetical protein